MGPSASSLSLFTGHLSNSKKVHLPSSSSSSRGAKNLISLFLLFCLTLLGLLLLWAQPSETRYVRVKIYPHSPYFESLARFHSSAVAAAGAGTTGAGARGKSSTSRGVLASSASRSSESIIRSPLRAQEPPLPPPSLSSGPLLLSPGFSGVIAQGKPDKEDVPSSARVTSGSSVSRDQEQKKKHKQDHNGRLKPELLSSSKAEIAQRYVSGDNKDQVKATQFLQTHDKLASEQCHKSVVAEWNYATNITQENKETLLKQSLDYANFQKESWTNATSFAWKGFQDPLIRRWFKMLSVLGKSALSESKLRELNEILADMENVYSTAKICPFNLESTSDYEDGLTDEDGKEEDDRCDLSLEPDLTKILSKSTNYEELVHVWKSWRDKTGKELKQKYIRYVHLSNEAAKLNGFNDTGELWRERYESDTFESDLENLWEQLKPLYQHLHAYVRKQLILKYGASVIKRNGPIPAHLLGNMWAQSWRNLQHFLLPYPNKPSVDVTSHMIKQNLSVHDMFKISEEFFTSLGLKPMPAQFWDKSVIVKPKDREVVCHASAWDFCTGKDFRIKQCTEINMRDLIVTHHEMGHIQYFMQYAHQPYVFREGANPGFHEAVGDVLALSVSTPMHLKKIGLLDEVSEDEEGELNYLMALALDKIAFLPSGYLMDLWRWKLFSGEISVHEMNRKWWELRNKYQGVCPPVRRTESDFDPASKYHIAANVPYIRYFVSFVIQFQFHKSLCESVGHKGPLHKCDIYRSQEAGQLLSEVLELGSSEPWNEAMKIMTGGQTERMDAKPILDYFDPLLKWLKTQLDGEQIGWTYDDPMLCPGF